MELHSMMSTKSHPMKRPHHNKVAPPYTAIDTDNVPILTRNPNPDAQFVPSILITKYRALAPHPPPPSPHIHKLQNENILQGPPPSATSATLPPTIQISSLKRGRITSGSECSWYSSSMVSFEVRSKGIANAIVLGELDWNEVLNY